MDLEPSLLWATVRVPDSKVTSERVPRVIFGAEPRSRTATVWLSSFTAAPTPYWAKFLVVDLSLRV